MPDSLACLAVVPIHLRSAEELDVLLRCLVSLRHSAPQADVLVVDDGSPAAELVDMLETVGDELRFELHRRSLHGGFAQAVNVGLRRALDEGRDAVLVNADVEFDRGPWLEPMLARTDHAARPAAVVGARLLHPFGLLQHAGIQYSKLTRFWSYRLAYGAADLPEAMAAIACPVTGALQLIRHETLVAVGLYDDTFRMAWEDVDYCLRVFASGRECIYEPAACATHGESQYRADAADTKETPDAWRLLKVKYDALNLSAFTPVYE